MHPCATAERKEALTFPVLMIFLNLLHNNLSPVSKEPALSGASWTTCRRWCCPPPRTGAAPGEPTAQRLHDAQPGPSNQHGASRPSAAFPHHRSRSLLSQPCRTRPKTSEGGGTEEGRMEGRRMEGGVLPCSCVDKSPSRRDDPSRLVGF